jgi:predicted MPP superfamily phosphohydrolase
MSNPTTPHKRATQFNPDGSMKKRPFERAMLRHGLFHHVVHWVGLNGLAVLIWPRFFAPYRWKLTRHAMTFPNLPADFEGYRILQLTDFHLGRAKTSYIERVIDKTMEENAELVVMTGDWIDYHPRSLEILPAVLKRMKARDGVVGIFGNHDYHENSWRHVGKRSAKRSIHKRLVKILLDGGVKLLRNEQHIVQRGAAKLKIVGMDELWAGNHNPAKAFEGVTDEDICVCLQHNPDGCATLKDFPWRWMLCGHSHGGQVDVPILGPMYVPQEHREWLRGMFEFPDPRGGVKTMFVSTGIGHSQPYRMRVPPEATVFTLKTEP